MIARHVSRELIGLSNMLRRISLSDILSDTGHPTQVQYWFLNYIYEKVDHQDVFQKDLEAVFKIRRSTATSILKLMERNGYITRSSVDYDARLKKISLTSKGFMFCDEHDDRINNLEAQVTQGFSEEELMTLFILLDKIKNNIE